MSEMEGRKGIIRKYQGDSEAYAEEICNAKGENKDGYDSFVECLCDWDYKNHICINNDLYLIIEDSYFSSEDDYCNIIHLSNGDISYKAQFYNGGTCLNEVLDENIK